MNKLMDFNSKVLHDLQDGPDMTQTWGNGKSRLVKTLQHSLSFLELLGDVTHSGDAVSRSSSSGRAGSRHGGGTLSPGDRVDTDLALQLLSCNMNVWSMYKTLYTELTTHSWQLREAEGLPELSLQGLQGLDPEMRVQVLVHMCSLTLIKIQRELESIRRRGLLTQKAERTFQTILEVRNERTPSPALGMEQILGNLGRLLEARDILL
jgi:hypothetical protein